MPDRRPHPEKARHRVRRHTFPLVNEHLHGLSLPWRDNDMKMVRHNRPLVKVVEFAVVVLKHMRNCIRNRLIAQRTATVSGRKIPLDALVVNLAHLGDLIGGEFTAMLSPHGVKANSLPLPGG